MTALDHRAVAGVDVGTECVKVVVLATGAAVVGRAVVATGGYFQDRIQEALAAALDEAQVAPGELGGLAATGFGARCLPEATLLPSDTACHARGAFHHHAQARTVLAIGGRDPKVIQIDDTGRWCERRTGRKCAVGVGTFLMYAARHLDVHPTRLMELAAGAERPAPIGNYCSVFGESELLERLREGATREEIALGCIHSIAERIAEIGGFEDPIVVTGGVAEYFPGVVDVLAGGLGCHATVVPEPILAGALGAALLAAEG